MTDRHIDSVHAPDCDGWKVYDNANPEPGFERYIAACDGSCVSKSDRNMPAGEISEGACILEPVGGSYYPKCVRCGWKSAVGWSSLEQARRSCEHECRPDTSDDPVAEAFQAQAFVVDRPWSDADYVIIGHPGPHEGTLLAVCTEVDTERDIEEGDEWPYTAQDAAREIARRWNAYLDAPLRSDADAVVQAAKRMPEVRAVWSDDWIHPNMPEDDAAIMRSWSTLVGRGDQLAREVRDVRGHLNELARAWIEGEGTADELLTAFFENECMPSSSSLYEWQKSRERMAWVAQHRSVEAVKEARNAG